MRRIFKWRLNVYGAQTIRLPRGTEILTGKDQDGALHIWGLCDPEAPLETRWFLVVGTGHDFPSGNWKYIATAHMCGGGLVWHMFVEETKEGGV